MFLSKPLYSMLGVYFEQLYNHPVRTKSITSCALAASANYTAQYLEGEKSIDPQRVLAYGLFGLIFGGSVPHYFYQTIERLIHRDIKFRRFFQFLCERLIYTPFYQALSLYFLSRFELKSHENALKDLKELYWPLLRSNLHYITVFSLFNIYYVSPMLRPITMGLTSFAWIIYTSYKRRQSQKKKNSN